MNVEITNPNIPLPTPQYPPQETDTLTKQISTTYIRTNEEVQDALNQLDELYFFFKTAPVQWSPYQLLRRYYLNNDLGFISCILWNHLYYITGTDIVKCCIFQMEQFGRRITQRKKFEEGIFSDLRNLKCGIDATLEQPRSDFLQVLFKNFCLKTQKKQKIFFWFSVPHLELFVDALERDLKREGSYQYAATEAVSEPALSFRYNSESDDSLMDQLIAYLNDEKSNDFTNINTPSMDSNDIITKPISSSHSNSSSVHLSPTNSPSSKPNLSLQLPTSFNNSNNTTQNETITTEEKINSIQSTDNNNNNNSNDIITHTLILNPNKPNIIPSIPQTNSTENFVEPLKNNIINNNSITVLDKPISNNTNSDFLFSPLNTDFNNVMDNLKAKDFPLDYLPVIEENSNQNIKQEDSKIPIIESDQEEEEEEEEDDDDENIVVPVSIDNLNKNSLYSKPLPYQTETTTNTINPHVMTNKEYYSINNKILRTNKNENYNQIEVTMIPYDQRKDNKRPLSSNKIEFSPVQIENDKDSFFPNELLDYDQYNNTNNNGLKISEQTRLQENQSPYDEFAMWGNSALPPQQQPAPYNMAMNLNQYMGPPQPYNNTITPVTKFNPYMNQSPWGLPSYPPPLGTIYGMNSSPRLGSATSQTFIIHPSRRPYSRPTSSLSKQFPINNNNNTSIGSNRTSSNRIIKPGKIVKPIDLRNVKIQRKSDNDDLL